MNLIDRATIIHFHRHRIATYASGTVKALGWKGAESQIRRFEVLAGVDDLSGCSVLDLGCGYGDLKPFLDQGFTDVAYIGVDQMHEFVREAAKRHGRCRNTRFFLGDFTTMALPRVDYVLASGAFGYLSEDSCFPGNMIRRIYQTAEKGVAFNMLDAEFFPPHALLKGHNREKVVSFCRELTLNCKLITGYLEDDFTLFLYK